MVLPADYHMHTPLCRHAVGEPTDYAAQAVRIGLAEIGFSDHSPMVRDDFDDWRMRSDQLDEYVGKVERARREHPGLQIKLGLEVDYLPGHEDWIQELSRRYEWDYLIGSVHYVSDSWALDNPHQLAEWEKRDPLEVWSAYFERLMQAAESRLFDIIGHADLCKKFCIYPAENCGHLFRNFLKSAARTGVAIEINTAGLRKKCQEMYPSPQILHLASEYKVPLTFGSDAHAPGEVGLNFNEAIALARQAGYTHWQQFSKRRAKSMPI